MKWAWSMMAWVATSVLLTPLSVLADLEKLPLVDGKEIVATVDGEPITLKEFNQAIASSHLARSAKTKAGAVDFTPILRRIINTRLVLAEAKSMGLDQLPEVERMVADYSRNTLMELLVEHHVRDVKEDEAMVEKLYQDSVREWKIKSLDFKKEEDAKKIHEEIMAGKDFDKAFEEAVATGIAQGEPEGQYLKQKGLRPRIAELVSGMEVGSVSPVVFLGKNNFVVFKLEGTRYPDEEDANAKENAARLALNQKRVQVANEYYAGLKKKYVTINEALFDSLDYESNGQRMEELLADPRVLVEIAAEKPLTVGEFTTALEKTFHHGIDAAIESQRVNKKKTEVLEDVLQKRVLLKEALQQGLDKTEDYKHRMMEYEHSVVFGAFVEKVVTPEIKMTAAEVQNYYHDNIETYSSPEMLRIKSLVFMEKRYAAEAMEKLGKGIEFEWLRSRAEGQIKETDRKVLMFEGKLVTVSSLPSGLQKVVSGAKPGDFRLYESPEGLYHVLFVYDVVPSEPQPFEEVKEKVAEKVYNDKLKQSVEHWADQLREHYPVKIFAKDLKP